MSIQESNVWKTGFFNPTRLELFSDDEINKNILLQKTHDGRDTKKCYINNTNNRSLIKIRDQTIIPYIKDNMNILEIGPGRGSWTKTILNLNKHNIKINCFDVFSAEHNNFWEFVGKQNQNIINYFKVDNNLCNELNNDTIDFVFSYDVFCHISFNDTEMYLKNLYNKLKNNAICVIMIADYDKSIKNNAPIVRVRGHKYNSFQEELDDINGPFYKGRFYYYGLDKFCSLIYKYNYTILQRDIDLDYQNPICIFTKQ